MFGYKCFFPFFDFMEGVKREEALQYCDGTVLNVGCGLNTFGDCGIDKDEDMLRESPLPHKVLWDVEQGLPFDDGSYDYVYSSVLLHHVRGQKYVLGEMLRVCRRGVVVHEVNITNPLVRLYTRILPWDKDAHFFNRRSFRGLLQEYDGVCSFDIYYKGFLGVPHVWLYGILKKKNKQGND